MTSSYSKQRLSKEKARSILFISSFPPALRGESWYSYRIVKEMRDRVNITILSHRDDNFVPGDDYPPLRNANLISALFVNKFLRNFNGMISAIYIIRHRPDIIHIIGPLNQSLYGGTIGEGMFPIYILARLLNLPTIMSLHTIYFTEDLKRIIHERIFFKPLRLMLLSYLSFVIKLMFLLSTKLFVVTSANNTKKLEQLNNEYKVDNKMMEMEIHPRQILPDTGKPPSEINREELSSGMFFAISLGYYRREKGYHLAIKVWKILLQRGINLKLIIAGPVVDKAGESYVVELKRLVSELNLNDNVYIISRYLSEKELKWLLDNSTFMLVPYTENKGMSGIVSLGRDNNVPVICTGLETIKNEFPEGVLWCKPELQSMTDTICDYILNHDQNSQRISRSSNNIEFKAETRSFFKIAKNYLDLYSTYFKNNTLSN